MDDAARIRSTPSHAGYTLIEVLMACVIVGVVLSAAVPQLPRMLRSYDLQNTTFRIVNDLRLARERAIATNGKGRIVFGSGNYQRRREDPVGSGTYVDDGGVVDVPDGTTVTPNPVDPTFDSRGLATAPYTITLDNGYTTKTITVTAIGRVNVD
jgi:prepilin-type N-terminal cleavage/methylation domain-containing protein